MTLTESIPIWLDCDTGNDDTFAILLAALHQKFNLVGISTVYGNAPLPYTTHNTLAILDVLGFKQDDIKVYSGSSKPFEIPPRYATSIHGPTGIEGATLPKHPTIEESKDQTYLEAIKEAVLQYKGRLNIVSTGALTNVAKLFQTYPGLRSEVNFLAIMGGGIELGNITKFAEFNVHCDPHAAQLVLGDPVLKDKTVLVPLNVTNRAIAKKSIHDQIYIKNNARKNSNARKVFYDIISFYGIAYNLNRDGFGEGPPIHDPLTIFVLMALLNKLGNHHDDEAGDFGLKYVRGDVDVVIDGEHEGQTVLSKRNDTGTYVTVDIDYGIFWSYILEALDNSDLRNGASEDSIVN
ncbi:uridine nucleosidase [[Candida] railenensis]|uniref:Uridine nucleosidase n=1 Tax=[Candida] railenensis TaxID=45579 RepID=A0A9P0QJV0_9ASCO|nr:uridine nucleosidase [[Candida] railenensis]